MLRQGLLVLILAGSLACHPTADSSVAANGGPADAPLAPTGGEQSPAKVRDRSISIARDHGHIPHEVELDPRGQAALTLDEFGGLRLWPAIRSTDVALASPYALPLPEPLWMSLAQAPEGGFVVAIIDTTNAGQVVAVNGTKLAPLFSIPPTDPLLEIHALDGGQRFLALGVDHRVRLYDRAGALLSVIDERSVAPWQLRVVHAEPGQPPKIAAMLAQPLRVQAIALRDDQLSLASEARAVVLDRGPNRNDLLLSPDGQTVAALRRPRARGNDFSIELIDLQTDARRLVGGRTDSTIRPRMHFVDADRILLEDGSSGGRGVWVELGEQGDLSKTKLLTDPADADPDSKLAERLYKTKHASIPVPASAEHRPFPFDRERDADWDEGERLHASVVAGVRVNVERFKGQKLIVDDLASDRHLAVSTSAIDVAISALNHTGSQIAWADDKTLTVQAVETGGPAPIQAFEHGMDTVRMLAFLDERQLLLVDRKSHLRIYEWPTAKLSTKTRLDSTWGIGRIAYHPNTDAGGVLGYASGKQGLPVHLVEIADGKIVATTELSPEQRSSWIEILKLDDAGGLLGLSEYTFDDAGPHTGDRSGRLYYTQDRARTPLYIHSNADKASFALPAGNVAQLHVSPDGTHIAVLQSRKRDDNRGFADDLLSVLDTKTGERLWTSATTPRWFIPAWSGDSKRIAINLIVHDASTGELLNSGSDQTLIIEDRSDADWATQTRR